MTPDFYDLSYLKRGNKRQVKAYKVIKELNLFEILKPYHPFLAGTIPIGIDIEGSDLDILCEVYNFKAFQDRILKSLSKETTVIVEKVMGKGYSFINFQYKDFPIEIFGQPLPVEQQHGLRHMLVEHRLLQLGDEEFRQRIINLKRKGIKTEPAFAQILALRGDPYCVILELEDLSDEGLCRLIRGGTVHEL